MPLNVAVVMACPLRVLVCLCCLLYVAHLAAAALSLDGHLHEISAITESEEDRGEAQRAVGDPVQDRSVTMAVRRRLSRRRQRITGHQLDRDASLPPARRVSQSVSQLHCVYYLYYICLTDF